jgi:hypothetical protein
MVSVIPSWAVALIVKRTVGHAGFSPEDFSGHSLRTGLATSAAERGQHERDIMQQTRHKSVKMLRRYIRKGRCFKEMSLIRWGSEIRRIALAADLLPKRGIQLIDLVIRHAEAGDYKAVITIVDDWWGGRRMALMLPKLFFVHFRPTSFVAEHDGLIVGFVIGFISQTHREEGCDNSPATTVHSV